MESRNASVYLCLITWPNGIEGLLFPRPGNVPVAVTREEGQRDFEKALSDLHDYVRGRGIPNITIRLVELERKGVLQELTLG